ncbi:MAG: aminoacyl-tRNA deacylase [Candidatus Limiplasma sp.]|nr:aminoacyl-tRNA deacylase [Candidatus Limiplasma sp.]MEA5145196.1 aminoacyl-tRNA deacylase [Candidatus Limiplasma sp.]
METKTNVMRILDSLHLGYTAHYYAAASAPSGVEVAQLVGIDPAHVFKTLVTRGKSERYFVFMIPVAQELNLKKAAAATGEKSIEMVRAKELLPLTGYVHGGCSPIGMRKPFETYIDASAVPLATICFSAGKIGSQVEMPLSTLRQAITVKDAFLV